MFLNYLNYLTLKHYVYITLKYKILHIKVREIDMNTGQKWGQLFQGRKRKKLKINLEFWKQQQLSFIYYLHIRVLLGLGLGFYLQSRRLSIQGIELFEVDRLGRNLLLKVQEVCSCFSLSFFNINRVLANLIHIKQLRK